MDVTSDADVVDSLCRIGQTAERTATKLSTVTLRLVTSSSSESQSSESQSVVWLHFLQKAFSVFDDQYG